jgi:hypothetical protein
MARKGETEGIHQKDQRSRAGGLWRGKPAPLLGCSHARRDGAFLAGNVARCARLLFVLLLFCSVALLFFCA